jgi:hypothetical protein
LSDGDAFERVPMAHSESKRLERPELGFERE